MRKFPEREPAGKPLSTLQRPADYPRQAKSKQSSAPRAFGKRIRQPRHRHTPRLHNARAGIPGRVSRKHARGYWMRTIGLQFEPPHASPSGPRAQRRSTQAERHVQGSDLLSPSRRQQNEMQTPRCSKRETHRDQCKAIDTCCRCTSLGYARAESGHAHKQLKSVRVDCPGRT